MQRFSRTDRVSELIHRAISSIIDFDLKDSRIGMVTVTGVEMSKDLKNARVYISVLGDDSMIESSLLALNSATHFIRGRLKEKVILKYLPNIVFYYDSSMVTGCRIDKLLDEAKKYTENS